MSNLWLGPHVRWEDFSSDDVTEFYPKLSDCMVCLVFAVLFICVRVLCEKFLLNPLALYLGVYHRSSVTVKPNGDLENCYKKWGTRVPHEELRRMSVRVGLAEREVERWLRSRRAMDPPAMLRSFCENGWHFLYYSSSSLAGLFYLWDKPWLWDTTECWKGWPKQPVSDGVFWMYQIQMGFYVSLLFSILLLRDHKKKDKTTMYAHHVITLFLLVASWVTNLVRVGTLVLAVHDVADPGLALAKMAWHAKRKAAAEKIFFFTILLWVLSRLTILPFGIIRSSMFETQEVSVIGPDAGLFWVLNALLCALVFLHITWTISIVRIAMQKFTHGELQRDVRSETDSCSDQGTPETSAIYQNGKAKST
ncbi:ceramide synthase 5 [Aplysia californica]|uniref:Ceramide synthase 5 n=1 Tax=Aplysia californica TaxID=6500 RepID=A0ABM0JI10_APLCA|nr:ceramide synthase 5 [Aplysia californica]